MSCGYLRMFHFVLTCCLSGDLYDFSFISIGSRAYGGLTCSPLGYFEGKIGDKWTKERLESDRVIWSGSEYSIKYRWCSLLYGTTHGISPNSYSSMHLNWHNTHTRTHQIHSAFTTFWKESTVHTVCVTLIRSAGPKKQMHEISTKSRKCPTGVALIRPRTEKLYDVERTSEDPLDSGKGLSSMYEIYRWRLIEESIVNMYVQINWSHRVVCMK